MLGCRRLLLAVLLAGSRVDAADVRFEELPLDRETRYSVAWTLPAGFDESELLLEIAGGPRVRLTDEIRSRSPRVEVVLPRLTGRARFVVRAGRDGGGAEDRGLAERDVAFSESFALAAIPAASARPPVRAAASRPARGHEMEWWSEAPARGIEGPCGGLSAARVAGGGLDPDHLQIEERRRQPLPASSTSSSVARARHPVRVTRPSRAPFARPFSGAAAPLRN